MVASSDVNHLVEGIVAPPSTVSFRGKPQIWFSRSDDDVFTLLRASSWNTNYLEGGQLAERLSSTTSRSVCLGGVALRGLDFGSMDSRLEALSGIVAMPTADRFCEAMVLILAEYGFMEEGGSD